MGRLSRALTLGACLAAAGPAWGQAPNGSTVSSLTIFVGRASGLYRSNDWGSTWQQVRGLSPGADMEKVGAVTCLVPLGPQVYLGASTGVYLSIDFGETWRQISTLSGCTTLLPSRFPAADPTLFLGTPTGLQRSSPDHFATAEDADRLFTPTVLQGGAVYQVAWPGPALIVATADGLGLSNDAGQTFVKARGELPPGPVTALAVSSYYASDPALLVAVRGAGVLRSTDGGDSWRSAGLADREVNDLYWLGPLVYAATDAGVFRTDDLGQSWEPLVKGIEGRRATRFLFPLAPASGAEIFLATDGGLFWTGNGGLEWTPSGRSLGNDAILSLGTFPAPDRSVNVKKKR